LDPAMKVVGRTFLAVALGSGAGFVSLGALLPTLPRYADGPLGAGPVGIGAAVGATSLTALLFQPLAGRLCDLHGRRPLMLGGLLLMAGATAAFVLAHSLPLLVALRLVAGVGEALLFVGAASAVNDLAPPERRGQAFSLYTLALYGGLAVGPVLGDLVLGDGRYDAVWLGSAAVALAGFVAVFAFVPETRPDRGEEPQPLGRLVYTPAIAPGLVLLTALFAFGGFNAFVALYALELGFERTGIVFATLAVIVLGVRSVGSRLPDVLGPRRAGAVALLGVAAGMLLIAADDSATALLAGTVVFSFGQALAFPAMMTYAVAHAGPAERGAAVGTVSAFVDLAIVSGAVTLGALVQPLGYRGAFAVAAAVAASGLLLLSRLRR
jgi:MFS family permease